MVEEFNTPEEEKKNAGWIGIICSALFPIVGIILYFAKNNSVKNPSAYFYAALVGFCPRTDVAINLSIRTDLKDLKAKLSD